jgi:hypothetical protein
MPHLKQRQGWRGDVLLLELENGHAFGIAPAPGNLTQQLPDELQQLVARQAGQRR